MKRFSLVNKINKRGYMFFVVYLVLCLLVIANAFKLQVIEGEVNLSLASKNSTSENVIRAPRGLIYDRNGYRLVNNDANFNLYVAPSEVDLVSIEKDLEDIAKMLGLETKALKEKFEKKAFNANGDIVGEHILMAVGVDYNKFLKYFKEIDERSGIYVQTDATRRYIDSEYISHIVGYVGSVTEDDVKKKGLDPKASIGKDGVEKSFDTELRGEDGLEYSNGENGEKGGESWIPQSYKSGDNIYLTIDINWQKSLFNRLKEVVEKEGALGGAAIVMDSSNGQVLSMANYPTYDVNLFAEGISDSDFKNLLNNDATPLLNRAIAMQIPVGSTFKIFMASSLLQEQVITQNTVYKSGCFELPGDYELCEADRANYGQLNMTEAIARSSNPYFCQASVDMAYKIGDDDAAIRRLDEYFDAFNLGKNTGIDLDGEQPGTIPSPELKRKIQKESWYLADMCNTAIGQGLVSATPLQMVTALSGIVNEGNIYKPQIVGRVENSDDGRAEQVNPEVSSNLPIDSVYLQQVKEGMRQAAEYGSARGLNDSPLPVIAKTGSSEAKVKTQSGKIIEGAHSWVVGSFEKGGRNYTFAVSVQFGGRGYKSVPIIENFINDIQSF